MRFPVIALPIVLGLCTAVQSPASSYRAAALRTEMTPPSRFAVKGMFAPEDALTWSTFLGGYVSEMGFAIAVDSEGCTYVAGQTWSSTFPVTPGALDVTFNGTSDYTDGFVAKLNASGTALEYCTFIGGPDNDDIRAIAVDSVGCAYVTGCTDYYSDFPTTPGAYDRSHNGGADVFVAKLNPTGTALEYSTFLGGSLYDGGRAIAIDTSGCAYVAGETWSLDFPTTSGAFERNSRGYGDTFLTKLNPSGSALVYSTLCGGQHSDSAHALAVDVHGCAYIIGDTTSADFPTTAGAFDRQLNGGQAYIEDVFVTKIDSEGKALVYSTFLGGSHHDYSGSIALDSEGGAYMSGHTHSSDFPTTPGAFSRAFGGVQGKPDAFVARLNPSGSDLVFSTYLGGADADIANGIAVDPSGYTSVCGETYSENFPVTEQAFDTVPLQGWNPFVAKLNPAGSALIYSTFLGGGDHDSATSLALEAGGSVHVTGFASFSDFPTTVGAFDTTFNGGYSDVFVSKLQLPQVLTLRVQPSGRGTTSPAPGEHLYASEQSVPIATTPTMGYAFDRWEGEVDDPSSPATSVTMDASKVVTAVFSAGPVAAKDRGDGASFSGRESVITAVFPGFFYIEADDRQSGIRVECPVSGFTPGHRVDVEGTMRTNPDGERYVEASAVNTSGFGSIEPLGMSVVNVGGRDWCYDPQTGAGQSGVLGGAGLNNIGLLVSVAGEVSSADSVSFYLDDGSGVGDGSGHAGVKVLAPSLTIPAEGTHVRVTGISSVFKSGLSLHRLLLPRGQADITPLD